MSYFPGPQGAVTFEPEVLVWEPRVGETQRVPWASIRSVKSEEIGAMVTWAEQSLLIPSSVVWFEFMAEDLMKRAIKANPAYEGQAPIPRESELAVPPDHQGALDYTRAAQRFYGDRCPNYYEFKAFLAKNRNRMFDESSFYECSMSVCSGSPVREGFSTDLVIPKSENWYNVFEKKVGNGRYRGRELLEVLNTIEPYPD